ncbi:MAG: dienelactone hydrolase family protein [Candidatus Sumerlaeota bacterium]|nr:dienelactone hydrolase family protein [Candidatus Sumerlaeota bacterium]
MTRHELRIRGAAFLLAAFVGLAIPGRAAEAPVKVDKELAGAAPAAPGKVPARLEQNRILVGQLMVAFRAAKNLLKPDDPRKPAMEALETQGRAVYMAGKTGEVRRMLYRALATLGGLPWTARDDYWRSLVLRTDMAVTDASHPLIARLEQIYPTTYTLHAPLKARASLVGAAPAGQKPAAAKVVKDLGTFEALPSDLIDEPFTFAADLRDVAEGNYLLGMDITEGDAALTRLTLPICLVPGMASAEEDAERRLKALDGHDGAKATIRYPFDFALHVNLGQQDPTGFDFVAAMKRSSDVLAALEAGRDPTVGAVGEQDRHYFFKEAGEIMPYRLYVPKSYDGSRPYPLIVALHGMGGTERTMIPVAGGDMAKLAESHGYIVASPLGYRRDGGYGRRLGDITDPLLEHNTRLSEMDVMNVLALVRSEFKIDDNRIYLMGHSMGGGGTWRMGADHPEIWAALAPISAGVTSAEISPEAIRQIPVLVSHGDSDPVAPVASARSMVAKMKELGMTYEYFEKPGGTHAMVQPSLPKVFDFFDKHHKGGK